MKITIRSISDIPTIQQIADLMQRIWQLSDREVVPVFEMKAVSSFGTLLGAFNNNEVIGFIYAMPMDEKTHYSHMMGVDPRFQGQGIGFQLKQKHRELALSKKVSCIKWTFDPLLPNNARLNFFKLGCVCNTYYPDYYGSAEESVGIYAGIPTDRFLVEWYINNPPVADRMLEKHEERITKVLDRDNYISSNKISPENLDKNHKLPNRIIEEILTYSSCLIEIPNNFQNIRLNSLQNALNWRFFIRNLSTSLFSKDYIVSDFIPIFSQEKKSTINYYLFEKKN